MSTEENKAIARRLVEEVLNKGNMAAVEEYFASNYVDHAAPPGVPPGLEGVKMFFGAFRAAFPDLHYHIDDEIAEGDMVVHRLTGHGTMKGEFQGMPATGKHATWSEIHIGRFAGSKLVEHWGNVDQLGMLQQLGLAPMPGQGG
jgi:predicted ester cyclase